MTRDHIHVIKTFCESTLKEEELVKHLELDSFTDRELIDLLNLIEKEIGGSNDDSYERLESLAYEILFILEKREKNWIICESIGTEIVH